MEPMTPAVSTSIVLLTVVLSAIARAGETHWSSCVVEFMAKSTPVRVSPLVSVTTTSVEA